MAGLTRRVDGIDVYEANLADWPGVADMNCSIGIAKAWHETDAEDRGFRGFWPAMRDAGLIRGAYLLLAPNLDKTRAQIETMVGHFTARIDAVGGLGPGDLTPIIDYEGGLPAASASRTAAQKALDQLAWALNALIPYTQSVTGRQDALPMVYTGRATWLTNLANPTAADMSAFRTADGDTIDFTRFPLWWAWLVNNALDPLKAADLASVQYPKAWPGPRHFYLQYSGGVPFPNQPGGQPTHDASIVAEVDAANTISVSSDFSDFFRIAGVAPPTADIELSRVAELASQPPDQVFSLLLIGQGYWPQEFEEVVREALFGQIIARSPAGEAQATFQSGHGVMDIAPLNLLFRSGGKNGIACYYDAGTHSDGSGLSMPLRQEATRLVDPTATPANSKIDYDTLRIGHQTVDPPQVRPAGRTLSEYLSHLKITLTGGKVVRASDVWPSGQRRTGPAGSLVVVLRKPQVLTTNTTVSNPRIAEYYKLDPDTDEVVPYVAVNAVPQGSWPLTLARAIAQNLAGLGDEYELDGADFNQPPEGALNPLAPNVLNITDAQRNDLIGGKSPDVVVPSALTQWAMPKATADFILHSAATANPILPSVSGPAGFTLGGFHMVEGGDGFRTHTIRCDEDCLMRRIPAAIADGMAPAPAIPRAFPIQSGFQTFCQACQTRIRNVIQTHAGVAVNPRIEIDSQRRLFDFISWNDRKTLPLTTVGLATSVTSFGPLWSAAAEFAAASGFRFTDIKLIRPDYWTVPQSTAAANVLKSVSFTGLSVTLSDNTTKPLALASALAATKPAPIFEAAIAGDKTGAYQVGARLSLSWHITGAGSNAADIDAELSLVLASMNNDIDPSGAMVACRIYPQLTMRVRSAKPAAWIKSLQGTIVLEASNADASTLTGNLKSIANGKLVASVFSESNRSGQDLRKRAAQRTADVSGSQFVQPLPYWSWIYDYCNTSLSAPLTFTGAFSAAEAPKGSTARDATKAWPAAQTAASETIHKVPRQGVYDSLCIHPDRGNDAAGHPVIGGPINADLALHLFWRRGVSYANGPSPMNIFRGWGAGRMDQGANALMGAPCIPPNQRLDVTITPAASEVTVNYAVTVTDVSRRWHVFMEQGLAFAFQYAAGVADLDVWGQLAWLAEATGAGVAADIDLDFFDIFDDDNAMDAKAREVWGLVLKRVRFFDAAADGSAEQQVPDGPSDLPNLENL